MTYYAARRAKQFADGALTVVDLETTGFSANYDEIIQIGVVNQAGDVLLDTLVKPLNPIFNSRVHGITTAMVADAPTFPEIYPALMDAIQGKIVLSYNWSFDWNFIQGNCRRHKLAQPMGIRGDCIMKLFAQYIEGKKQTLVKAGSYFDLTFEGRAHSALVDAQMALAVLKKMAEKAN